MDELQDLAEEWDLTLGTVSGETREVYSSSSTGCCEQLLARAGRECTYWALHQPTGCFHEAGSSP